MSQLWTGASMAGEGGDFGRICRRCRRASAACSAVLLLAHPALGSYWRPWIRINSTKVHIFWEGHKVLRNLYQLFDWQYTQSPIIRNGPIRLGVEFWGKFKKWALGRSNLRNAWKNLRNAERSDFQSLIYVNLWTKTLWLRSAEIFLASIFADQYWSSFSNSEIF